MMNTYSADQNTKWRKILWFVLSVFIFANVYLLYIGEVSGVLLLGANTIYLSLLAWLTWRVTKPISMEDTNEPDNQPRLWMQITILLIIILLTGINSINIPPWSNMVAWSYNLGESILPVEWFGGPGYSIANPMQYFVIPFVLLVLLGAKPVDLGFGKGNKVWQACIVWLALPILIWSGLLITGSLPLQVFARHIIGNTFQNGFFEEFLFRGALLTRLRRVVSTPLALTIQAVLFGLWHLQANIQMMDGNFLAGLAVCLVSQTVSGFVYGYVYQRTKNLTVPSIAHVAMNVLGQSFG